LTNLAIASNFNDMKNHSNIFSGIVSQIRDQLSNLASITICTTMPAVPLQYAISDECLDDAYCIKLYEDYLNDTDSEKDEEMSFDEVVKALSINLP